MNTHTPDTAYDPINMLSIMEDTKSILARGRYHWVMHPDNTETHEELCPRREWHRELQDKYQFHFVVEKAIHLARPDNWQQLLLEWPHVSTGDSQRLAYTRNEPRDEFSNKKTVTSVAKYLRSHFSTLPDHAVRDLAALVSTQGCFLVDDIEKMVYHKQRGPYSCMQWESAEPEEHPYNVYDPAYGWKLAVRQEGGDTIGNCLVMDRDGRKYFVRSYLKDVGRYSHSDPVLEAWLTDNGFDKRSEWQGERMAFFSGSGDGGFLAPYIDGNCRTVDVRRSDGTCQTMWSGRRSDGREYLFITDGGDYMCDNTDGHADYANNIECEDCGDRMNEDEGYTVGRNDSRQVCSCCHENYCTVLGRRRSEYMIEEGDAVYVDSQEQWYDSNYLGDNDIVSLENGTYEHSDNAVLIGDEWYHIDNERIVRATDTDDYALIDDCWICAESNNWYTNDCEDWTEDTDGTRYHNDHIPPEMHVRLTADDSETN